MKIAELFYSIQGEGILAGVPSVFIRTSGCNLRCWWCDTPYASWTPEGQELSLDQILEYVRQHSKGYVVITGGEPMIARGIVRLTGELKRMGQHITIETAGTVYAPVQCDLMSLSPKLSNSTPSPERAGAWAERHERLRIRLPVLRRLMHEYDYQLKFVVRHPGDLAEVRQLAEQLAARPERVLLMPEGTDPETLRQRAAWIVEACKELGFRYTPRLHIELYGNRRGV